MPNSHVFLVFWGGQGVEGETKSFRLFWHHSIIIILKWSLTYPAPSRKSRRHAGESGAQCLLDLWAQNGCRSSQALQSRDGTRPERTVGGSSMPLASSHAISGRLATHDPGTYPTPTPLAEPRAQGGGFLSPGEEFGPKTCTPRNWSSLSTRTALHCGNISQGRSWQGSFCWGRAIGLAEDQGF